MSRSVVDLLTRPEQLAAAKASFLKEVAGSSYRSRLPPGQKPPVDLNAEEMARFRDLMRPRYLKVPIRFR